MTAVIALLLATGARVDAPTFPRSGYTPIHLAVRNPDPEAAGTAVRLLVAVGASPSAAAVHEVGFQPLHIVHLNPNPAAASAAVKALLEAGADVNGLRSDGMSPLHENAGAARQADVMAAIIPLLLEAGADPNATDDKGCTSLHFSASTPSAAKVAIDLLMATGTDILARDLGHWEPLHLAAKCCAADNISALVSYGADVSAKGDMDFTPLHYAVVRNTPITRSVSPRWWQLALISQLLTTSTSKQFTWQQLTSLEVARLLRLPLQHCSRLGCTARVAQGGQPLHYAALAHTAEGATGSSHQDAAGSRRRCPLENAFVNQDQDARIAAATALWEAGGHYYSLNNETQEWYGPASLAEITGGNPLESMNNMLNNPEVFANLDADMQKLLIDVNVYQWQALVVIVWAALACVCWAK